MKPFLILSSLLLCSLAWADIDTQPFQYQCEVDSKGASTGLIGIPLDEAILRKANPGWSDLRLLSGSNHAEVPYFVEKKERRTSDSPSKRIATKILSANELAEGVLETEITLTDKKRTASRIEFETPLRDFEKRVIISGSDDGETWETIIANGLILDRSHFLDFRRTSLDLPPNDYRHFQIRIDAATDEQVASIRKITRTSGGDVDDSISETMEVKTRPFRVDRINFYTEGEKAETIQPRAEYELAILQSDFDEEKKESVIEFDSENLPLNGISLTIKDQNFRRYFHLFVEDKGRENGWRQVTEGSIHSYSIESIEDQNLEINFGERSASRWRLTIEQGDNPAISVESVRGLGEHYRLLTLASDEEKQALYFGADSEAVSAPDYDTAAIELAREKEIPVHIANVGKPIENTAFSPPVPKVDPWYETKTILWIAIALVVLVMTWVILKTTKQIESVTESD
ncbi:MAG: hypothetical protein CMO55_21270 [Verrucomicrobiales bacterium]|nr:hypothetical protein [Verrucomicrobiales bacterium]